MTLVLRPVQSHIISISGRAGTGKSAMAKGLLKKFGRYAKMVPSYMTREKRPNEKEGFDGVFITHAEFEALIEKGAFTSPNGTALWVEQGGNYYGRRADDFMHSGVSIIDVSYSGLELMRKAFPDQVYAVLIRSNMSDERNREILEARGVHEPEEIERRVRIGRQMMQPEVYEPLNFNFITANRRGELDKNVAMVAAEFRKWRDAAAVKDNPPLLKMGTPLLHKPSGGRYIVKETEVDDDGTWFVLEDDSGTRQFVSEEELLQMYTQYPTSPEWRANPPVTVVPRVKTEDGRTRFYNAETGEEITGQFFQGGRIRTDGGKWSFDVGEPIEALRKSKAEGKSPTRYDFGSTNPIIMNVALLPGYGPVVEFMNYPVAAAVPNLFRRFYAKSVNIQGKLFLASEPFRATEPSGVVYAEDDYKVSEEYIIGEPSFFDGYSKGKALIYDFVEVGVEKPEYRTEEWYWYQEGQPHYHFNSNIHGNLPLETVRKMLKQKAAEEVERMKQRLRPLSDNPPEDISVEPMSTTPIHYAVMMDEYHELREKSNRTRGEDKRLQYLKSFLDALGVHTDFRTNPPGVPKPGKELSKERKREIRKKWLELVNMTQSELQAFYDSEWGNEKAGLSREEAREQGISSGRDSALAILKMKETPVREWHKKRSKDRGRGIMLDFWQWAQKQINFNTRHRAMQGAYLDDKGRPKRKLLGLWIWGHDPWRYALKVEPERMPTAPDVVWVGRKEKEHFGVGPVGGVHANPPAEEPATMLTGFQTDGKGSSYNLLRSNGQTIPVDPATKPNGEHPVFGKRYAKKFSRQDHPAFSPLPFEARRWKKSTFKTGAETDIDSWEGKIDDSMGATVTLKIDGEGTVAHFDGNETVLWNWYDRWRTGFHITDVLTKRLKSRQQIKSAKIMGELFAVDADGNMLPMTGGGTDANGRSETSSSIIKSPQTMERQQRIRWLAFDILEVDGQDYSDRPFDERLSKLVSMLGRSMVVPHIKARGPSSQVPASKALETAWREWGHDPEFEGAVLHLFRRQGGEPIGVYKVKGAATADMVVMGGYWGSSAQKDGNKGTFADMVGGLAVGWMMPNGDFVYSGNVGTGFNFSQREDLVKVIRKHGVKADTPARWGSHLLGAPRGRKQEDDGNGKMVALDPHSSGLIVEVEYRGLNWSERPVYRFKDSVMYQVGTTRAPTLFQPSFKRFREDKSVSPDDLRMSQVAGEGEGKWTTRPEAHGAARRNPIPKGMRKLEGKERPTGPFYHGTSMRLAKKYMEKGKEDRLMYWGAAGIMKGEGQLHESHNHPNAVMGMFVTKSAFGSNSAMAYAKGAAMMEYHWEDNDEATPVVLEVLPDGLDFYSAPNTAAYQSDPKDTFIVVTKGYDGNSPDTIPPENLRIAYVDEEYDPWAPPWDEDYGSSRPLPTGRHGAARKKKQKGSNRICPHPEKVKFSTMAEADAAIPIHKRGWVRSYRCPVDGPAHYHHTKNLHRNAPSKNRARSIRDSEVQSFRIPRIRVYPGEMTPGLLRKHRDHIFLFGDNERREGKGGQAKIRDEPNAFGIRTKRAPNTNQGAYWSDENYQQNIEMMADDFRRVFREIRPGTTLVIPGSGLGTGRALLPERAPKTFEWLLFVVGSLMMMADKNPAKGGL